MAVANAVQWTQRHLIGLEDLSREEIEIILDTAPQFLAVQQRESGIKKVPLLQGRLVVNLFLEPSTRTRVSFELAAKRLSADTLTFTSATSSAVKGESLHDTLANIEAMHSDIVVIRSGFSGAPSILARRHRSHIVNAGDGAHEHPTQALLDAFTIRQHVRARRDDPGASLDGLRVAFIGDIANSRVARSNIWCLTKLGAQVTVCGPRTWFVELPSWLTGIWPFNGLPGGRLRWNPVQVVLSSQMGRTDDRRTSFLRAVRVDSDTGRRVTGLTHVWRNTAAINFRPVPSLTSDLRLTSVRDLRDYGDTSAVAIVASSERERVLGTDIGLERERQITSTTTLAPVVATWLQPSVSFTSNYSLQRDPQSRVLVRTQDTTGAFRLPRRLFNSQSIGTNLRMDPARALTVWLGDSGWVARAGRAIEQLDLQYSRSLNSAFDGAPFTPGAGYQFGLGGIDDFRQSRGLAATVAGVVNQYSVSTGLRLPAGVQIRASGSGSSTENYTRRLDNTQALVEGTQQTLPDLRISWGFRPRVTRFVSNVTASLAYRNTRQTTLSVSATPDAPDDRRVVSSYGYIPSLQLDWGPTGRLRTNVGGELRVSTDSVPGSSAESRVQRFVVDVSRPFVLPPRFGARQPVRAQVTWEREFNSTYVLVASATQRSRLADAGRSALNVNVSTEVAQDFGFRLQAARVISYDNNYNTRFSTFVVTATFSLTYYAGQLQ